MFHHLPPATPFFLAFSLHVPASLGILKPSVGHCFSARTALDWKGVNAEEKLWVGRRGLAPFPRLFSCSPCQLLPSPAHTEVPDLYPKHKCYSRAAFLRKSAKEHTPHTQTCTCCRSGHHDASVVSIDSNENSLPPNTNGSMPPSGDPSLFGNSTLEHAVGRKQLGGQCREIHPCIPSACSLPQETLQSRNCSQDLNSIGCTCRIQPCYSLSS